MVEMPRSQEFQQAQKLEPIVPPQAPSRRGLVKRTALAAALMLSVSATGYFGYEYWTTGQYLVSTDDAYVKADYTTIAPKVSGHVADVLVADNEHVPTGKILAHIDDRDFRAALAQAEADVEGAEAAIRNLDAQIALQQSVIDQAKATIAATEASLTFAEVDADRYRELTKTGSGTVQRAQQTESYQEPDCSSAAARSGSPRLGAIQGSGADDRTGAGGCAARSQSRGPAPGGAQPLLYDNRGPGRRHDRRALDPRRSVRDGWHAVDGRGAARCGLLSSPTSRKRS